MSVDGLWAWGAKLWVGVRARFFAASVLLVLAACGSGDGRKHAAECQSDDDCDTSALGVCDTVSCIANRCELDTLPDGHRCNDDDPQTRKDACLSGICSGVSMTCNDDLGPCLKAVHDPVTDECTVEPVDDGAPCDDADACTQVDSCQAGECVGGEAKTCAAVDDCHVDGECDPETGECSDATAEDGAPCDDAQACTTDDACQDGVCGGQAVTCDDGLACSVDSCDENSGACAADMAACTCVMDADCSDGNACNGEEVCGADKLCKLGTAVTCPSSTNPCQTNVCVAETGACQPEPVQDGTACDDANACTARDTCQAGACVGADAVVCAPLSQCHDAGKCSPVTGACSNPEKANATSCNDGNACTVTDKCQAGACIGQAPVVCLASDQCHDAGVCNSATGICSKPAKQNGVKCDDANPCSLGDACQNGACTPTSQVVCGALDSCHTAGTCDPKSGSCTNPSKADGATCSDGLKCTASDVCTGGKCAGTKVACDDGIACTTDSCVEQLGGCSSTPTSACKCASNADCNDANPCNGVETCNLQTLQCVPGTAVDCSALNDACNVGACSVATGKCSASPKADGAPCDDGDKCTTASSCLAGACKGSSPVTCGASDQCHDAGTCNASTGVCSNPPKANGSTCNDGNECTKTDSCQAGACTGTNAVVCSASDQCHTAGTCDTSSGLCSNPAKTNGSTCDDGALCTNSDTCQGGVCAGSAVTCSASDQCHTAGTCNAKTGTCSNPAKTDGTLCDDGTSCTLTDSCQLGVCGGTKRSNLKGDWADDPGNLATSVDIFTDGKNNAHVAGTYTAALRFNDKDTNAFTPLGLPTAYVTGIYSTVYTEAGAVASALNIGGVGTDVQGLPGTLSVADAAGNRDGTFTLLGTFSGPATFGVASKAAPPIALNIPTETVFVARYAADGTILWVAPLLSDAKSNYAVGSLAAYDDGSVIASGTMTVGTTFYGAGARAFAFDDRAGVWAARLGADGAGQWASIVVTPDPAAGGNQFVGSVTTHEDGGATLTGRFQGNVLLGPKSEIPVATTGTRIDWDVWYLKLDKAGAKLWGGRVGGAGNDGFGDVARIPGGGALLMANTVGAAVNGSDSKTTQQFLATATTGLQTHIIGIDANGVMQTDALIANPTTGATRGWQLKRDLAGFYAVAGTFPVGTSFYSSVGFGTGAPPNPASFTVASQGQGPLTLFVARVNSSSKFGWARQAGGDGSGMTALVMTAHSSHSITVAGLFNTNSVFGDQVQETLSVAAGGTGNPFVVHVNSAEEYDYCP